MDSNSPRSAAFGLLGTALLCVVVERYALSIPFEGYVSMLFLIITSISEARCPQYILVLPALLLLIYNPALLLTAVLSLLFARWRLQFTKFELTLTIASLYYFASVAINSIDILNPDDSIDTMSSISCIGLLYVLSIGILGGHFLDRNSLYFSALATLYVMVCVGAMFAHMYFSFTLAHRISPLTWIMLVLLGNNAVRLWICLYWSAVLLLFLPLIQYLTLTYPHHMKTIIARKLFHFISVLLFAPIISYDADFMCLAFAVSLCALLLLEYVRCVNLWNINNTSIGRYFDSFIDDRDRERGVAVTHIYLLVGCALPCWIHALLPLPAHFSLLPHLGWITIGVGDAVGAIVGSSIGKHRYSATNPRTIEGSIAALSSMCLVSFAVYFLQDTLDVFAREAYACALALFVATIIEAFTREIDNLIVPLYSTITYLFVLKLHQ